MANHRLSIGLLLLVSLGCGGSDNSVLTADVAGTVTKDGKPLAGVEVFFSTEKFEGYGKTDDSGKYRLINGAAIGTNKIFMKKFNPGGGAAGTSVDLSIPGMDAGQADAMMAAQGAKQGGKVDPSMIPAEYNSPATTKLTFPVPEGGTESADFRL